MLEHAKGGDRGRVAAEHEWAEGDRHATGEHAGGHLRRGEIALGADEPEHTRGRLAEFRAHLGHGLPQRFRAGVQAGGEFEIVVFRGGEKGVQFLHGSDFGQPRVAALLGRLDGGGEPFLLFLGGAVTVEVDLRALRQQRHDAPRAQLGGLAHNLVHRRALGQGLRERDGSGQRRRLPGALHAEERGLLRRVGALAQPLASAPVEGCHRVAAPAAVDGDEVVALGLIEPDFGGVGRGGGSVGAEVGHGVLLTTDATDRHG